MTVKDVQKKHRQNGPDSCRKPKADQNQTADNAKQTDNTNNSSEKTPSSVSAYEKKVVELTNAETKARLKTSAD